LRKLEIKHSGSSCNPKNAVPCRRKGKNPVSTPVQQPGPKPGHAIKSTGKRCFPAVASEPSIIGHDESTAPSPPVPLPSPVPPAPFPRQRQHFSRTPPGPRAPSRRWRNACPGPAKPVSCAISSAALAAGGDREPAAQGVFYPDTPRPHALIHARSETSVRLWPSATARQPFFSPPITPAGEPFESLSRRTASPDPWAPLGPFPAVVSGIGHQTLDPACNLLFSEGSQATRPRQLPGAAIQSGRSGPVSTFQTLMGTERTESAKTVTLRSGRSDGRGRGAIHPGAAASTITGIACRTIPPPAQAHFQNFVAVPNYNSTSRVLRRQPAGGTKIARRPPGPCRGRPPMARARIVRATGTRSAERAPFGSSGPEGLAALEPFPGLG